MTYYGKQYCHNRTPSHMIISMVLSSPVLGPGLGGIMDLGLGPLGGIKDSSTVMIPVLNRPRAVSWFLVLSKS